MAAQPARKDELAVQLTVGELRRLVREEVAAAVAANQQDQKEILDFAELCELVDSSAPTVRRWIREDGLPCIKLGGRTGGKILKFRRTEVLAWLARRSG